MTFLALAVRKAARDHGSATALVAGRGPLSLSFQQLNAASEAMAARLAVRGVGQGQVAALLLPASLDYVVAYCALAKVGAVTAGVGAHYSPAERQAMLANVRPDVVIGTEELLTGRLPDAQIIPVRQAEDRREFAAGLPMLGREHVRTVPSARSHDDPETIVFTSGTSGLPKGALFGAKQIAAISEADNRAQTAPMPLLVATGLNHVGFMTKLAGHLLAGNRLHILTRWRAREALGLICDEGVPVIGGVAAQVALLLRVPQLASYKTDAIKALIIGGGPSPAELVRQARESFGAAYSIRYSSTESGGLGTLTALDAPDEEVFNTVGRPRAGTEISLRDEGGKQVPVGESGEVWMRSASVMSEYWHDPAATAETLTPDGWLRTGDVGLLDDTGCLRLAGRRDDMFVRGGYNVHPQEVEAVLQEHAAVGQIAVVPRPDAVMGQVGVAFVVPCDPAAPPTVEELRLFAGSRLARHKLPEEVRVVPTLPLTAGQKVDRSALRKRVGS
ncbi:AMP-dependent synthetase and ligase [Catenulispora acidiphila DSM 44928]|uniref:AMP-dependent synthetase and ligase n=1 Tax=Catenulispora acidiphila (strain DSM 44928 / JCM 14897 / NBRC 102108 / NRRL B-24433 / ID139908) TaxID=479433 RepID=C7Q233_CATAD|nr:class I adenylate-forming enzyme family protein [Catenulispora acidiphila]ACU77570.1 AMP-dependent synthetase and ligase [Catenulispora acidiphila DSM 44928]